MDKRMRERKSETVTVVGAAPGWFVCELCVGEPPSISHSVWFSPVVAWKVTVVAYDDGADYTDVEPISLEGRSDIIRTPEGKFICPKSEEFETEADVLAHLVEQYEWR